MTALPEDDPVIAELLTGSNLARVAYIGLDGRPRVVPIWFLYGEGTFLLITGPKAYKAKALAQNAAVSMTIDSSAPPYHVLLVHGDATVERTEGMAAEYPDLARRYLGPATDSYIGRMRIKEQRRIRITPTRWTVLDFTKRFPKSLA